jgi:hypothetical protein
MSWFGRYLTAADLHKKGSFDVKRKYLETSGEDNKGRVSVILKDIMQSG